MRRRSYETGTAGVLFWLLIIVIGLVQFVGWAWRLVF